MSIKENFYSDYELAEELGKSRETLRDWRSDRKGPAWTKVGRTVCYSRAAVDAWLRAQQCDPVAA